MRIRDLSSDVCSSDLFGVKPGDTIVELWPGGGWYTEILAPLTRAGGGTLYAAAPAGRLKTIEAWRTGKPDDYGAVRLAEFPHKGGDRTSVVSGKSVSVRVALGGRRIIKKKTAKEAQP